MLKGGEKDFVTLPNGQKRFFKDLISHKDEISKDVSRMTIFKIIYEFLLEFEDVGLSLLNQKLPPEEELLEIYGKILINATEISIMSKGNDIDNVRTYSVFLFY